MRQTIYRQIARGFFGARMIIAGFGLVAFASASAVIVLFDRSLSDGSAPTVLKLLILSGISAGGISWWLWVAIQRFSPAIERADTAERGQEIMMTFVAVVLLLGLVLKFRSILLAGI